MNPEKDAYGKIIKDIHTGENPQAGEIFERDDGYIDYTDSADYLFQNYEEWSEQLQMGIEHTKQNALDIGCGAERHSLYLQSQGVAVTGIDVSPKAVEVTKDRGVEKASVCGIGDIKKNAEHIGTPWDTILMMGNNLGLLGTSPIKHLQDIADVTTDNAVLIGQTRESTNTTNQYHRAYHEYNKARGRRPGCIRMRIRYKTYKTGWYNYLYLNEDELRDILSQTPWNIAEMYQDDPTVYTVVLKKIADR